jgi:serine/threonine protein kinase
MPSISSCLTMVDLHGLAQGRLPAAEVEWLGLHLGRCPHCADRFRARFGDGRTPREVADRPASAPPTETVAPTASLTDGGDAFARLTGLATEALEKQRGLAAVLWGEAGPERTELLGRLSDWAAERACFVCVPDLAAGGDDLPGFLLRTTLTLLTRGRSDRLAETPLFKLVEAGILAAVNEEKRFFTWAALETAYTAWIAGRGDRTVYEALFRLFRSASRASRGKEDGGDAAAAVCWLLGEASAPPKAEQVMAAVCRLAACQKRPFVLALSHVDDLDDDRFGALTRFLEGLLADAPNLLVVCAGTEATWRERRARGVLSAAAWERLTRARVGPAQVTDKGGTSIVPASAIEPPPAPPRQLRIGAYEVLEELGRGGMGVVYRVRHTRLGHEVALKLILSAEHASDQDLARFEIEAAAVAKLKHAGIVHIHEFGDHQGSPFFALELVEGGTLAARLKGGPLSAAEAAALVEKLARATQHAHEAGIIHRDLKPANVLLTQEGEPKITDFGLAKQAGGKADLSKSGAIMGTPAYMAPEQGEGKGREVGPAADVYALGGILYECLTGRTPFQGNTSYEVLVKLLTQEPPPPGRLVRGLPRDLETVCLRCLEKDPARRYATAAALADDLSRFLRREPVAARPVGPLGRAWRWARRNPAVAGLLATATTILVLGATVATFFAVKAENKAAEADRQREQAVTERSRAEGLVVALEKSVKEKGEETKKALQEKERVRSALKTAQLLRVEMVGKRDPSAGFVLLHDEAVWPTAERDFAWGVYNHWCLQKGGQKGPEGASLTAGGRVKCVAFSPDGKILAGATGWEVKLWDTSTRRERDLQPGRESPGLRER